MSDARIFIQMSKSICTASNDASSYIAIVQSSAPFLDMGSYFVQKTSWVFLERKLAAEQMDFFIVCEGGVTASIKISNPALWMNNFLLSHARGVWKDS